jgi:hypothetical protein
LRGRCRVGRLGFAPQARPAQNVLHGFLHLFKRRVSDGRISDHEDQIDAARDLIEAKPHGFADPAPGAVALHGVAQVFASDDAAARLAAAVGSRCQAQQPMLVCSSFAPHTLKLPGTAQPMGPLHSFATAHHLTCRKDRHTHDHGRRVHLSFQGAFERHRSVNKSAPFVA